MRWDYECAIIGGGPGGLVSALYLRRFRRKVILFNSGKPRAAWIPRTHNLIGYHRGISGEMLLSRLHRQLRQCGLERVNASAEVRRYREGFVVKSDKSQTIKARKVILATGIEDVQPAIENVAELRKLGLLRYCSICDGYEYVGEPIAVIARDDAGIQKALFLSQWTQDIRIIVPSEFKLAPKRVHEVARVSRAKVYPCTIMKLEPSRTPRGLQIYLDNQAPVYVRVAYIELGASVLDTAFKDLRNLRRSRDGFILTTTEQRTSIPGLFAVGDCVNLLGQISVAAGQAAVAATTIHNDLLY